MAPAPRQRNLRRVPDVEAPARDIRARRPYLLTRRLVASGVRRALCVLALVTIDVAGVATAVYGALVAKELYRGTDPILWGVLWQSLEGWLPFLSFVTVLVFWRGSLYGVRERRAGFAQVLASLAVVVVVTLAFAIAVGHQFTTYSTFVVAFVLASAAVGLLRWSYEGLTGETLRALGARRRAILIGSGTRLASLRRALEPPDGSIRYDVVETLDDLGALRQAVVAHRPDELLLDGRGLDDEGLLELLDLAHEFGIKVGVAPTTTELLTHQSAYVPGRAVPIFELRPPVLAGSDWVVKRVFDLAVSTVVLVAGLPLWLAIATAIKLTSPGPVLYRDSRIGVGEREFRMLKFRTMVDGASQRQLELETLNEADGALFKLRRDPRVTSVGRALRRLSLDEIPQVLNVLRGEMSLVGPRPLPLRDYQLLEPWHRRRYFVLPGITGLWQISGRSNLGFDDLVRLDFFYIESWSIWLDVSILVKTIPAVLTRRGAY